MYALPWFCGAPQGKEQRLQGLLYRITMESFHQAGPFFFLKPSPKSVFFFFFSFDVSLQFPHFQGFKLLQMFCGFNHFFLLEFFSLRQNSHKINISKMYNFRYIYIYISKNKFFKINLDFLHLP